MNYEKNPKNLRSKHDYCKKAQRYKLHPDHHNAIPRFKYLAYEQCLPGCIVRKNYTEKIRTQLAYNGKRDVPLTSETECVAYDNNMENLTSCSSSLKALGNFYSPPEEGM